MVEKLRYEIYLPTCYNNKQPVEAKKFRLIQKKLLEKCKGYSIHPATIEGAWVDDNTGIAYFDNCRRFEITVEKNPQNQLFFEELKEELKVLLQQHQVYMICTEVDWV